MHNPSDTIKPRVRELRAYTPTPERASVKINQNENPWNIPARIREESLRRLNEGSRWPRYPDFVPTELHRRLAAFTGWKADGIIAGNGSNELIQALLMVTIGEGRRVVISEPTFALYRQIATVLGGEITGVPLTSHLTYDTEAINNTIERVDPDVTIICSPNNPTGCMIDDQDLVKLLLITRGLVVVDEAYFDFAERTVVPLLEQYANLVVLRTFSKAMGLAGLRIGYLLAAPSLTREISKAVLPYNLNFMSQTIAEVAVEMYDTELRPLVREIISERERVYRALQQIQGLTPVSSQGNFMLVRCAALQPRQVFTQLLQRDILIRDVSGYPMLSDCLRISVGTPVENDLLLTGLREIFKKRETMNVKR